MGQIDGGVPDDERRRDLHDQQRARPRSRSRVPGSPDGEGRPGRTSRPERPPPRPRRRRRERSGRGARGCGSGRSPLRSRTAAAPATPATRQHAAVRPAGARSTAARRTRCPSRPPAARAGDGLRRRAPSELLLERHHLLAQLDGAPAERRGGARRTGSPGSSWRAGGGPGSRRRSARPSPSDRSGRGRRLLAGSRPPDESHLPLPAEPCDRIHAGGPTDWRAEWITPVRPQAPSGTGVANGRAIGGRPSG